MSTDLVDVFLGDLIEDDSEWHVLNRLRDDLTVRGIHARIFANFFTNRRRYQRQVDLLVVTAYRVTVIELKNYNPAFPLNGGLNGPWTQALPDGRVRQLDGNPIRQAGGCTFAVSDDMRALADRGDVPREDRFYRYLDSVVCVYPHVPAGSTIAAADHVTVVGYDELIDRLGRPGPRPRWEDRDWDRFARYVELHPFASMEAEPAETQQDHLRDYCRRFVRGHEHSLHELVPLAGRVDGQPVAALDVASAARLGRFVTVIGRSGTGKSHLARHTALDLARAGHFVVWARCDEYRPKRLSVLLARSVAPYTTADARSLIDTAARAGREAVLILDGLNETDGETQRVLLEQLASLRLRHRAGVVITSTEPVAPVDETTVSELETQLPSVEERRALLRSHGAARPDDHSEAFRTPFELSLAARCVRDLDADATRSSLFDAYILRRTGSLTIRTVLRQIARLMNEQMTGSLALARVLASLERSVDPAFSAQTIDAALASPLLDRTQGRVRFTHELFAQFLAADELVLRASSGTELGELLGDPRHRDLTDFAVDLEISPGRRHQLVRALGDDRLLREGLLGRYGSEMRSQLTADARALFADAIELTSTAWLDAPDAENPFTAQWRTQRTWNFTERSLLVAASKCLPDGLFVDEIGALLEATDQRADHAVRVLRERGSPNPITVVVATLYGTPRSSDEALPASVLVESLEFHARWTRSRDKSPSSFAAASALWALDAPRGWGLLFLSLQLARADHLDDQAILPDLLAAAWNARGYHLQLAVLDVAHHSSRDLHGTAAYDQIARFLGELDPSHWALSSTLVEALASYDAIEPLTSLAAIRNEITEILAACPSEDADAAAFRVYSSQFENEHVLGPYSEAMAELPAYDRQRLLTMAARGRGQHSIFNDTLLAELAREARPDDSDVFDVLCAAAAVLDVESGFPQEAVSTHIAAVQGLATFTGHLPDQDNDLPRAWRLIDELLLALNRNNADELTQAGARTWPELLDTETAAAVDVLYNVCHSYATTPWSGPSAYVLLTEEFPEQVRQLLEWALVHPETIESTTKLGRPGSHHRFIISELGRLGTRSTAELLEPWIEDPTLGEHAVAAVRRLRGADS